MELPGTEISIAVHGINAPAARETNLRNLEFLEAIGSQASLKGGLWRDLLRACEILESPSRMPQLLSQYRAALQRVRTKA